MKKTIALAAVIIPLTALLGYLMLAPGLETPPLPSEKELRLGGLTATPAISWSRVSSLSPCAQVLRRTVAPPIALSSLTKYVPVEAEPHLAGSQAIVLLDVLVDSDGRVSVIRTLQGSPIVAQKAIDAVRQWRFEETKENYFVSDCDNSAATDERCSFEGMSLNSTFSRLSANSKDEGPSCSFRSESQ